MSALINRIGHTYGRLTVIAFDESGSSSKPRWLCRCQCGNVKSIQSGHLPNGQTKSCGCLLKDLGEKLKTHGLSKSAEYRVWTRIKERCYNPKKEGYIRYGGRGISVCDRWLGESGFNNFLKDMGKIPTPRHSIDRINTNGNYEPSNCRWATAKEQALNRRNTKRVLYKRRIKTLVEWCESLGIPTNLIRCRMRRGQSFKDAIKNHRKLHGK